MGEKPEVLEAVLKEAVDLVIDLSILEQFWCLGWLLLLLLIWLSAGKYTH